MKKFVYILMFFLFSATLSAQETKDTVVVGKGWKYVGQWPEGEGIKYSGSGITEGHFVEGKAEGMCSSTSYYNDYRYYGNFKNGKRDGYGRLARPAGFFYEGEFKDGYPEGVGTMFFSDNFIFKGTFHLGKPQDGSYFYFKSYAEMKQYLPEIPDMKLTKEHKKQIKGIRKLNKKKSESEEEHERVSPLFLGGPANLFSKWVNGNLKYPEDAKMTQRDGEVVVRFTITETGELADPYISKSSSTASLDCEALRVVLQSPDWTPGTLDGKPVSVSYSFPVYFMLKAPGN